MPRAVLVGAAVLLAAGSGARAYVYRESFTPRRSSSSRSLVVPFQRDEFGFLPGGTADVDIECVRRFSRGLSFSPAMPLTRRVTYALAGFVSRVSATAADCHPAASSEHGVSEPVLVKSPL